VIGKMVLKPGLAGLGRIEVPLARSSGLAESGILVIQSLAAFMTKNTLPALTAFLLAAIGPALAQDLPPYQSLETRHVCTAQPIHETPAGTQARVLGAGAEVMLRDVTFGPEGGAWFALDYPTGKGLERAIGYLPVSSVKHFCAPEGAAPEDSTSRLQSYLAPPNTCHVVAARADTVEELNGQARSMPTYAPVISGYRLHSGGYALSLGLVSTNLRDRIGSPAARVQTGITCVSGADFAEALVHDGTVLTPADPGGLSDDAARLSTALLVLPDNMADTCVPTTAQSLLPGPCRTESPRSAQRPHTSRPDHLGKTVISRASAPACVLNFSMVRSSIRSPRSASSWMVGDANIISWPHMDHSATNRRHPSPSGGRPARAGSCGGRSVTCRWRLISQGRACFPRRSAVRAAR
jgi:hypothetical protein